MIDLTDIDIRIGGNYSQYLNVHHKGEAVGSFRLSEGRIVAPDDHERQPGYILEEVRRLIEPVVIAAGRSR